VQFDCCCTKQNHLRKKIKLIVGIHSDPSCAPCLLNFQKPQKPTLIRHQNKVAGGPGFSFLFFFPISWNQNFGKCFAKISPICTRNIFINLKKRKQQNLSKKITGEGDY
jgi:hypothetical protein